MTGKDFSAFYNLETVLYKLAIITLDDIYEASGKRKHYVRVYG